MLSVEHFFSHFWVTWYLSCKYINSSVFYQNALTHFLSLCRKKYQPLSEHSNKNFRFLRSDLFNLIRVNNNKRLICSFLSSLATGQVSLVMVEHISLVSMPTGENIFKWCALYKKQTVDWRFNFTKRTSNWTSGMEKYGSCSSKALGRHLIQGM